MRRIIRGLAASTLRAAACWPSQSPASLVVALRCGSAAMRDLDWIAALPAHTERIAAFLQHGQQWDAEVLSSASAPQQQQAVEDTPHAARLVSALQELFSDALCREALLTGAGSLPTSADALERPSHQLLRFGCACCCLLQSPSFCQHRDAAPVVPLLREAALHVFTSYAPYLLDGRTHSVLHRSLGTEMQVMVQPVSSSLEAKPACDAVMSQLLLQGASLVLTTLSPPLELLPALRGIIRPSLTNVQTLSNVELCDLAKCLASTAGATLSRNGHNFAGDGVMTFEEHNECVVLAGEVVRRVRRDFDMLNEMRHDHSKSSAMAFSLEEKKRRLKLEAEREAALAENRLTMTDLSELATCFGVMRFRDGAFAVTREGSASPPVCNTTPTDLWSTVSSAVVRLVEEELAGRVPLDSDVSVPSVSFTMKDLKSVCFAMDTCGQASAYHDLMECLVRCGVVASYIEPPSAAVRQAFRDHGRSVDGCEV